MSCCVFTLLALPASLLSVVSVTYVFWFFLGFYLMNSLTLGYWFRPLIFWSVSTFPYEFHLPKMLLVFLLFVLVHLCPFSPFIIIIVNFQKESEGIIFSPLCLAGIPQSDSLSSIILLNNVSWELAKSYRLAKREPVKCQSFPPRFYKFLDFSCFQGHSRFVPRILGQLYQPKFFL